MLGSKKVLAVVAARGGSKGLPRKNVLDCAGKPLIAWTLEAARGSRFVDRAIVSSDDDEILAVARRCGGDVPFTRPAALAADDAPMDAVVAHALDAVGSYDICVLLQATSPLRTADDIDGALQKMAETSATSVVSVTSPTKSPYWMYTLDERETLNPLFPAFADAKRRQDLPAVFVLNGAVYAVDVAWFRQHRVFVDADTIAYRMPGERSVDVDTEMDLVLADALCRVRTSMPISARETCG